MPDLTPKNFAQRLQDTQDPLTKELAASIEKRLARINAEIKEAAVLGMIQLHEEELADEESADERAHIKEKAEALQGLAAYTQEQMRIAKEQSLLDAEQAAKLAEPAKSLLDKMGEMEIELLNLVNDNIAIEQQQQGLAAQSQTFTQDLVNDIVTEFEGFLTDEDAQTLNEKLTNRGDVSRILDMSKEFREIYDTELNRVIANEAVVNPVHDTSAELNATPFAALLQQKDIEVKRHQQVRDTLGFTNKNMVNIEMTLIQHLLQAARERNVYNHFSAQKGGALGYFTKQLRPHINQRRDSLKELEDLKLKLQIEHQINCKRQATIQQAITQFTQNMHGNKANAYALLDALLEPENQLDIKSTRPNSRTF